MTVPYCALKQALDGAIQALLTSGTIEAIMAKYGVPLFPSFE